MSGDQQAKSAVDAVEQVELDALAAQFTYHAPIGNQLDRYAAIRAAGWALARVILGNCPRSADRTAAIRKVREACMTANAAIAIEEAKDFGSQSVRLVAKLYDTTVMVDDKPMSVP